MSTNADAEPADGTEKTVEDIDRHLKQAIEAARATGHHQLAEELELERETLKYKNRLNL